MSKPNNFYTASEAAERFGVDRRTISRWVKSGKLEAIVTPGGHSRILISGVDASLEKHRQPEADPQREKTILIVDDDESVRSTLKQRFIHKNFNVETASDGFKAGLKIRQVRPVLVILDLMMKGIDGFEVCRTIKADQDLKDTKILIMTGFDTPENRARAMREGADEFMSKREAFDTMMQHVNNLLNR